MLTDEKEYVSHKIQEHMQRYTSWKKKENKRENGMAVSACQSDSPTVLPSTYTVIPNPYMKHT